MAELPARTKRSDAMSKDLKTRGFKFVGSTICYAFMQATGMVNDHQVDCFRWRELFEQARALYENLGFWGIGRRDDRFRISGRRVDDVLMVLDVF